MLNATSVSAGSGLDEASALRAQLAALNEKFRQLEKAQSSQLAVTSEAETTTAKKVSNPTTSADLATETEAPNPSGVQDKTEGVQAATSDNQPSDVCKVTDDPPATVEEGTEVPPASENRATDVLDEDDVAELEGEDEVLSEKSVASPPPIDEDDQGDEEDLGDEELIDLEEAHNLSAVSDDADPEEFIE